MTAREDDWRLRGQDTYLAGVTLVRKRTRLTATGGSTTIASSAG